MITVKNLAEHYHGPTEFDHVIPFGDTFEHMRSFTIPEESKILHNSAKVRFLGFKNADVRARMHKITELANHPGHSPENHDSRYLYQKHTARVFDLIVSEALREAGENPLIIAPLRAGALIAQFYKLPEDNIFEIEAKRLPKTDGSLELGLIGKFDAKISPDTVVIIAEGCVATGSTVAGLLQFMAGLDTKPKLVEVNAAAIAQHGAEYLLEQAEALKIPLFLRGAIPVYAMDEKFYLLRTPQEGYEGKVYSVGDAGDWSLPLPEKYNHKAWWNRNRNEP